MSRTRLTHNKNNGGVILGCLLVFCALAGAGHAIGTILPVDANMVFYYHLNQNASAGETTSLAYDWTGNGNNGTLANTVHNATGGYLSDGAYGFNGGTSSIDAGNKSTYNFTTFTLQAWIYVNTTTGNHRIIDRRTGNSGFILYQSGAALSLLVGNGSATVTPSTSTSFLRNNTWYLVTGTYNGSQATLFVNGIRIAQSQLANYNLNYQNIRVGRDAGGSYFSGFIDEVAVYNRSLSTGEIWNNYVTYYGSCFTPIEDLQIGGNATLCSGNYSLNDEGGNGTIQIIENSSVLTGSGTNIIGNLSAGSVGVYATTKTGISVQGISFYNLDVGVQLTGVTSSSVSNIAVYYARYGVKADTLSTSLNITSSYFENSTGSSPLALFVLSGSNNPYIYNNTLNGSRGMAIVVNNSQINYNQFYNVNSSSNIAVTGMINITIDGNRIYSPSQSITSSILATNASNISIRNNYVEGSQNIFTYNILLDGSTSSTITNNTLLYTQYQIFLTGNNSVIQYNNLSNSDQGSRLSGINNSFLDNRIDNITANYDLYDLGLKIIGSNNTTIVRNNFTRLSSAGVVWLNSTLISLANNSFGFIPFASRSLYAANDYTDPPCAMKGAETYKSFLGEALEASNDDNVTFLSQFDSHSVTLSGNTFDANTQCMLWDTGGSVSSNDLTSYYLSSFRAPTYLHNTFDFYIPNAFTNLSYYKTSVNENIFQICYYGDSKCKLNASIGNGYQKFVNVNNSSTFSVMANNLTDALTYYANGTVGCSNIASCDGTLNGSISPAGTYYALDRYRVNQSASVRLYDPISVANSSANVRILTSTLTSTLTNVSVTVATGGIVPSSPLLVHPDGSSEYPSYLYANGDVTYNSSVQPGQSNLSIDSVNATLVLDFNISSIVETGVSHSFSHNATDVNNATCYFWLEYGGNLYSSNSSVTCNATSSFSVVSTGAYMLVFYGVDGAGNGAESTYSFTAYTVGGGGGGGGGGSVIHPIVESTVEGSVLNTTLSQVPVVVDEDVVSGWTVTKYFVIGLAVIMVFGALVLLLGRL